jgi:hypothetical protein
VVHNINVVVASKSATDGRSRIPTLSLLAVRELPLLDSKSVCRAGIAAAMQQNRFLSGNSRCYTGNSFPVRELPLLRCKIVSCAGSPTAKQQKPVAVRQNRFLARNCRCYAANPFPAREFPLLRGKLNSRAAIGNWNPASFPSLRWAAV